MVREPRKPKKAPAVALPTTVHATRWPGVRICNQGGYRVLPDGRVAFSSTLGGAVVRARLADDRHLDVPLSTWDKLPGRELQDFPGHWDLALPSEFDLQCDHKRMSDLGRALSFSGLEHVSVDQFNFPRGSEPAVLLELMRRYRITPQQALAAYREHERRYPSTTHD